jgi:hypothetical protein
MIGAYSLLVFVANGAHYSPDSADQLRHTVIAGTGAVVAMLSLVGFTITLTRR